MKIKSVISFLIVALLLFACKGTEQGKDSGVPTEKVMLTQIAIGSYSLTTDDMIKAQTNEGFVKVFDKNFAASNQIIVAAEKDASITFNSSSSENITLNEVPKTVTITVRKARKLDNVCKLILSKEESAPPSPTEKATLTEVTVASYSLTSDDLAKAQTEEGFIKVLPKDPNLVYCSVSATAEPGATAKISNQLFVISKDPFIITITVTKEGKLENLYKLIFSKEE